MIEAIQSTKYPSYYRIPDLTLGVATAPWRAAANRGWGRKPTIDFLINLGWWWDFSWNPYDKAVYSSIYIGDISPDGGAHQDADGLRRYHRDKVLDHTTHKSGHDIDIFFVRKDGKPEITSFVPPHEASYDLEQNIKLARMIVRFAERLGLIIGFFHGNDKRVQAEVPKLTHKKNHEDHFHVTIVHPSEVQKK